MRVMTLLFLFVFTVPLQAQNFEDDFSDGDFSADPVWSGDNGNFIVHDLDGNNVLRLGASGAGSSYLSTPSTSVTGSWEFFVRIDGSAPSGGNKAEIFLMSDIADLSGAVNGYAVRIGETGDDEFKIVRFDAGSEAAVVLSDTTIFDAGGSYRIKVTRDGSGNWSIEVGEGYNGELKNAGATALDNTYTNAAYFGVKLTYTSTRVDDYYLDFKIEEPPIEPLSLNGFSLFNATQVDLGFSRDIDSASVSNSDFTLNGSVNAQSVSTITGDSIRVSFTSAFFSGNNSLEISGIESSTNDTVLTDTTLTFYQFDTYAEGDVIINEFLTDPHSGLQDYVELRNTSSKYLNLKDWQIGDSGSLTSISAVDQVILPDSFIVVSSDTAALSVVYGAGPYLQISLANLNSTSSDQVRVYDSGFVLVDSLEYADGWGGNDVALERISKEVASTIQANWGDSPNVNGGTPGRSNDIPADETAPSISAYSIEDPDEILLVFSESATNTTASNSSNYELVMDLASGTFSRTYDEGDTPGISSINVISGDSVRINLDDDLFELIEQDYWKIKTNGLEDVFGNSAPDSVLFQFATPAKSDSGEVLITEFMYDPAAGYTEFIELYNNTDSTFNIRNWTVNDNSANPRIIIYSDYYLRSGDYLVLAPDSTIVSSFPGTPLIRVSGFQSLNNSSDNIVIRNENGVLIDSLSYASSWGGDEVSLERKSLNVSSVFQANWGDSPNSSGGTPGEANEIEGDTTPPELSSFSIVNDSTLQLIFSEALDATEAEDEENYQVNTFIDMPVVISVAQAIFSAPDTVTLHLPVSLSSGDFTLMAEGQKDIFGNTRDLIEYEFEYVVVSAAAAGDVAINEFMYDPAENYSEFIEIYNHTNKNLNLRGWSINDNSGTRKTISNQTLYLKAGEYLVLAPDSTIVGSFPSTPLRRVSGFPSLNNSTDEIVLKDDNGLLIDSLSYSNEWGGDGVSLERRSVEFSAVLQPNWGNSPSEDLGTPGSLNLIEADTTAPDLEGFTFANDSTVILIFNEQIKEGPASDPDNYHILIPLSENIAAAESQENDQVRVTYTAPKTVELVFKEPIYSGALPNSLVVENQEDVFGNVADFISRDYELIESQIANPGDVFINEFMYDPADGYSEFVEIYNNSNKVINLNGWTINDNSGTRRVITNHNFYIKAKQVPDPTSNNYVILVPDSTMIDKVESDQIVVVGSLFPSLTNTTDAIVIRNAEGVLMDSLIYTNSWGGNEISLERRTTAIPATFKANWGDSPSENLGTPGKQNEIARDTEPPIPLNAYFSDDQTVILQFSEELNEEDATDPGNFSLTPDVPISDVSYTGNVVTIQTSEAFADGQEYGLWVGSMRDVFGNIAEPDTLTFTYYSISEVEKMNVVINEIMYRPKDAQSAEFVELFNRSDKNFDLSGWVFQDAGNNDVELPAGTFLPKGGYLVLADREDFAAGLDNAVYLPGFPSLNDSGDGVIIKDAEGVIIDKLFYENSWGGSTPGISLERKDPGSASGDPSNWRSSTASGGSSVGTQSSVYELDTTPPSILFASRRDSSVFVAFSEFISITSNTKFFVLGEEVNIVEFDSTKPNTILLENPDIEVVTEPLEKSVRSIENGFRVTNISDIKGNSLSEATNSLAYTIRDGFVVINEIMYDPLSNSDDNLPDQAEYVELFNPTDYAVSLEGIVLHDAPDEEGEVRTIEPFSSQYKWIPPRSYFLIYSEDQTDVFTESKVAVYFEMTEASDQFTMRVDRSSLSLASSGDAVYLADSTGAVIDSVFYDESWQNPNVYDTDGIALERINPSGPGNESSNWSSSTHSSGGTPNMQNTIYQAPGVLPDGVGISFSPNPFSPDDDGFEDNLFINYTLDAPDYLLKVQIFDRYGRKVRELANGRQAGFQGSLIWDGLTDSNNSNRVGIYIVLFEAYNSATGKDVTFKKTVVLARMF